MTPCALVSPARTVDVRPLRPALNRAQSRAENSVENRAAWNVANRGEKSTANRAVDGTKKIALTGTQRASPDRPLAPAIGPTHGPTREETGCRVTWRRTAGSARPNAEYRPAPARTNAGLPVVQQRRWVQRRPNCDSPTHRSTGEESRNRGVKESRRGHFRLKIADVKSQNGGGEWSSDSVARGGGRTRRQVKS